MFRLLVNFLKLIQKYLLSLLFLIFFILKSPYFPFVLFQVKHLKFLQEDHQLNPHSFRHNPKELKQENLFSYLISYYLKFWLKLIEKINLKKNQILKLHSKLHLEFYRLLLHQVLNQTSIIGLADYSMVIRLLF